jgi:hypothetical protein
MEMGARLIEEAKDLRPRGAGWTVQLHQKGGQPARHALPGAECATEMLSPH